MASVQQSVWKEIPHLKTRKYFCSRLIFTFLNIFGNLVSGAKVTSSHHRWGDCTIGDSDMCISPQSPVLYLTHLEFTHGSNMECPESLQILSKRRTKLLPSFFPWGNQAGFYAAFYCQSPWVCKESYFCSAWIRLLSANQGTLPNLLRLTVLLQQKKASTCTYRSLLFFKIKSKS